ncbi:T9SS type A sorting domain-containing protein, partial [bacterium]|nr:T9SS type A sorting domain-containing protein [bacterium]
DLGGNIFNALAYGNASAWVYWEFAEGDDPRARGLVLSNEPTSRYYVSKQYYRFIRPGAVRVDAAVTGGEIPSLAFKNEGESTVSVVLINSNTVPQVLRVSGPGLPNTLDMYTTSNFRNCDKIQTVSPGGLFLLPASSITTLYGSTVTSVEAADKEIEVPENFALFQNFPNPFNPATTVAFQVPKSSAVILAVYDIMGREVRVLADAVFQAGRHKVQWDGLDHSGSRVSSGVYFIRIRADQYTAVKKTILLR